ncbi:DUF6283 family protein [Microbacterium sp. 13-71-7]|jgi:hypothetical protein|uniref:DUF6283 family protein n=1 Tax=Microbacterium sp. 13-71-7 TaxID=1970399 RepID=UPI000BD51BA6|nr:DUF6283 family protein [Microbacterium sp. 13-71-7]OZB84383.1 MAG: hypothetical protein B7X32_07400 [Microbacterium sp. 13-71-7]
MSSEQDEPRRRPCASCPYRRDVPSGVWHPDEYAKLALYDGETHEQPVAVFHCHQGSGDVCAGWLGHRDPLDLLAVRIGFSEGRLSAACLEYSTTVPLFESGTAAAEHGTREVEHPSPEAVEVIRKVIRVRSGSAEGPVSLT